MKLLINAHSVYYNTGLGTPTFNKRPSIYYNALLAPAFINVIFPGLC